MFIAYCILLYFYIGYTYLCWIRYRDGAGFEIHEIAPELAKEMYVGFPFLWPIFMIVHASVVIYENFKLEKIIDKISPESFHSRGQQDNDTDKQAEKHLLGVK